ncbi:MAG: hypothetical protein WDW36_000199 [Sanguina aurantia]
MSSTSSASSTSASIPSVTTPASMLITTAALSSVSLSGLSNSSSPRTSSTTSGASTLASSSSSNVETAGDSSAQSATLETATFGGGCFWCIDAVFRQLRGVSRVQSGFSGGTVDNPTYQQVMGKKSGHAEVVQLNFDPSVITYEQLLRVFFAIHDPTQRDRQGADMGPQYRSCVFYHSQQQSDDAQLVMAEVSAANTGWFSSPVVTQLAPAGPFWVAESYHQNFTARNPMVPYCTIVAGPKLFKVRSKFAALLKDQPASL